LRQVILFILARRDGATDRDVSEAIYGSDEGHQQINQECRLLTAAGKLKRTKTSDDPIRNYLQGPQGIHLRLVE
jgi:hypothetical protein